MKTIVFFSDNIVWSIRKFSGAPSFFNTLKLYLEKGHSVFLVQPDYARSSDIGINGIHQITFHRSVFFKFFKYKKIGFFARFFDSIYNKHHYFLAAKRIRKQQPIDLFYAYEINGCSAAQKCSKKWHVPFVTRFQGTICPTDLSLLNRIRYCLHIKALSIHSDLVIMTDDGTKGDLVIKELKNTSKLLFLRNGVDFTKPDPKSVNDIKKRYSLSGRLVFLTLSRVVLWKRIDRAILLVSQMKEKFQNLILLVVGDGDDLPRLKQMVTAMNLTNMVVFVGEVERRDISCYLACADVFLSLYDLSNVGNPLLEALSCGKMIVTLNNGSTGEVISNKENGLLFDVSELDKIPGVLGLYLSEKALRKSLEENAKKYASTHILSWNDRMEIEYTQVSKLFIK